MPSAQSVWIVKKRGELVESWGGRCTWPDCEETEDLEFAHVRDTDLNGRGRGRHERYYDILNNPKSYRLVCWTHHRLMDEVS